MTTPQTDFIIWWNATKYLNNSDKYEKFKIIEEITKGQPRYYKWGNFKRKALDCFSKGNIETKEGAEKIDIYVKSLYSQYKSIPNIEKYEELATKESNFFLFIIGFISLLMLSSLAFLYSMNEKRCSEVKCTFYKFFTNNKFLLFISVGSLIAFMGSIVIIAWKGIELTNFKKSKDYEILQELHNNSFWN